MDAELELPSFGKVINIYLINTSVYFHVEVLNTLHFNSHFHCYVVQPTSDTITIQQNNLFSFLPHHIRVMTDIVSVLCVVPKHHFICP